MTGQSFLPVGARVTITDWGRGRVHAEIGGVKMRAGPDHGHFRGSREQFADLLFVREDPGTRLASYPVAVQAAIRAGRIMLGMTKDQVLMALGPPRFDETPSTDHSNWVYFVAEDGQFDLDWGPDGTLHAINAPSRIRNLVEAKP